MATVWPGSATSDRSWMSGTSGLYENETWSNSTRPSGAGSVSGSAASGSCSSASSSSNTRSTEAMPDCSTFAIDATWVSGWVNWREYWMNACTSPSDSAPDDTRSPPMTAMATKFRLLRNIIAGWIRPEMNWALKLASYSSSFLRRKRSSTSRWRPNAFTMACPVKASSTCALSVPVCRHCAMNRPRDRLGDDA